MADDTAANRPVMPLSSLLLPVPAASSSAPSASFLSGSKDLISLFNLNPLYDTFVRPYLPLHILSSLKNANAAAESGIPTTQQQKLSIDTKGRGSTAANDGDPSSSTSLRHASITPHSATSFSISAAPSADAASSEMAPSSSTSGTTMRKIGFSMGGIKLGGETVVQLASDVGGTEPAMNGNGKGAGAKKGKKLRFERSYEGMVSDVAGRNTIEKDQHLLYLVMNPDFPPVRIAPFDEDTLRDGFTLRAGGIPNFDASIFLESKSESSPKKRKKKRGHDSNANAHHNSSASNHTSGTKDDHRGKKTKL